MLFFRLFIVSRESFSLHDILEAHAISDHVNLWWNQKVLSGEIFFLFVTKSLIIKNNITTLKKIRKQSKGENTHNPFAHKQLQYHSSIRS